MSKEDWFRAYELNLYDGMSETEAVRHADDRAAGMAAARLDEAEREREEADARREQ